MPIPNGGCLVATYVISGAVLRLHADGLRLGLSLDRLFDGHGPFLLQHGLGHAVPEGGAIGQLACGLLDFAEQLAGLVQGVLEGNPRPSPS